MRHHYLLASLAVLSFAAAASAVEPSDLKPGLVASFRDRELGATITRLEPTVALTLGKGETPHPKLSGLSSATVERVRQHHAAGEVRLLRERCKAARFASQVGGKTVLDPAAGISGNEVAARWRRAAVRGDLHFATRTRRLASNSSGEGRGSFASR